MTSEEFSAFVDFVQSELYAACPYKTGNMQRSVCLVSMDGEQAQIAIATDYAAYVNNRNLASSPKNHYHWVEKVIKRCGAAFGLTNVVSEVIGS